jgi:hypothetical protein
MIHLAQRRRARAKRSPSLPAASLPAPSSAEPAGALGPLRRGLVVVLGDSCTRRGLAEPASLAECRKPVARAARKPTTVMRTNGVGSVRLRGNTWTASLPAYWTEDETNPRLEVLAERAGRLEAARARRRREAPHDGHRTKLTQFRWQCVPIGDGDDAMPPMDPTATARPRPRSQPVSARGAARPPRAVPAGRSEIPNDALRSPHLSTPLRRLREHLTPRHDAVFSQARTASISQ